MCVCVYHINLGFIFKIKMYSLCAGTSVNNHKSNLRKNGEYFYMARSLDQTALRQSVIKRIRQMMLST